jgi:uncharacterized membrane protein YphA (DoxX/SURF4 family)
MFGPLPIRIMAGIAFIVAGLPKLENIAGSMSDCPAIIVPPTACIIATFGLRKRTSLIFPTNLLPLTNVSKSC